MERVEHTDLSSAEITDILGMPISANVAFLDRNGYPRMLPCWYVWLNNTFITTSIRGKFHVACLKDDPRGSFCVDFEYTKNSVRINRQVKGFGTFEILDSDIDIQNRIRKKYLDDDTPSLSGTERVVLSLKPEKLSAHGVDLIPNQNKPR